MRQLTFAILTVIVSLSVACGDPPRGEGQWPLTKDELERGSKPEVAGALTYRQYCVGCHGVDGRGNGGVTGADFRSAASPLLTKTDDELLVSVRDGKRGVTATMPAHRPILTDTQIRSVLGYVRTQFKPTAN